MKLALCQFDMKWEDKEANKEKILKLFDACPRRKEIDWLIFSEMTLSGFTMNTAVAELSDPDRDFFRDLARRNGPDKFDNLGSEGASCHGYALNSRIS